MTYKELRDYIFTYWGYGGGAIESSRITTVLLEFLNKLEQQELEIAALKDAAQKG